MYQVAISRMAEPSTTPTQVEAAMTDCWGFVREYEAVDAEHGIWLVDLTEGQAAELEDDGWAEWIGDSHTIAAEMA